MDKDGGELCNAIISQRVELAPGLFILRVTPEDWELGDFVAGQYAVLGLPGAAPRCEGAEPEEPPPEPDKLIKRAYSVASSSRMHEYLEFYIILVLSGALTPRLHRLRIGDRVWMGRKIAGMFTLDDVPADANVLLFATGTGIAPYMSMVRTVLNRGGPRRLGIIHAARHSRELGYRDELLTLEQVSPQLSYLPLISEPDKELIPWKGRTGFCQELWHDGVIQQQWGFRPSPDNTHVFLCGNPLMIEEMLKVLGEAGFAEHSRRSPGQVHLEKYW